MDKRWARSGERCEVVLAGSGGQGLVFLGQLLAESALDAGFHVVQTQSYGVASRGGFSKSEVIIASHPIAYPMVMNPSAVLALTDEAFGQYAKTNTKAVLLYDSDRVSPPFEASENWIGLPFEREASRLGLGASFNVMGLSALMAVGTPVSSNTLIDLLSKKGDTPNNRRNLQAAHRGLELLACGEDEG